MAIKKIKLNKKVYSNKKFKEEVDLSFKKLAKSKKSLTKIDSKVYMMRFFMTYL